MNEMGVCLAQKGKLLARLMVVSVIKCYQKYIPLRANPSCRFYPNCSAYFIGAVNTYGVYRGVLKGILRLLRCNPFFQGGFDPW